MTTAAEAATAIKSLLTAANMGVALDTQIMRLATEEHRYLEDLGRPIPTDTPEERAHATARAAVAVLRGAVDPLIGPNLERQLIGTELLASAQEAVRAWADATSAQSGAGRARRILSSVTNAVPGKDLLSGTTKNLETVHEQAEGWGETWIQWRDAVASVTRLIDAVSPHVAAVPAILSVSTPDTNRPASLPPDLAPTRARLLSKVQAVRAAALSALNAVPLDGTPTAPKGDEGFGVFVVRWAGLPDSAAEGIEEVCADQLPGGSKSPSNALRALFGLSNALEDALATIKQPLPGITDPAPAAAPRPR